MHWSSILRILKNDKKKMLTIRDAERIHRGGTVEDSEMKYSSWKGNKSSFRVLHMR